MAYSIYFTIFSLLLNILVTSSSKSENNSTTTVPPGGVKKCYKCEEDCHGQLGTVEDCHPDPESHMFACYTIIVDGKAFQRGCTLDSSGGEECVTEKGNVYCYCRSDECNNTKSASNDLKSSYFAITFVFIGILTVRTKFIQFDP